MRIFEEYPYIVIRDIISAFCAFGLPFYIPAYVLSYFFKARKKVFFWLSLLFPLTFFGCVFESIYHEFPHLRGWEWDMVADDLPCLMREMFTLLCSPFVLSRLLFKEKSAGNKFEQ